MRYDTNYDLNNFLVNVLISNEFLAIARITLW